MNTLCVYTEMKSETRDSLDAFAPSADCWPAAAPYDYYEAIGRYWGSGDDLVVIEHDIVITAHTLPSFAACSEPWCTFSYKLFSPPADIAVDWALGCTKFSRDLQAAVSWEDLRHSWDGLDVMVAAWLQVNLRLRPHCHGSVDHLHGYGPPDERMMLIKELFGEYIPLPGSPEDHELRCRRVS